MVWITFQPKNRSYFLPVFVEIDSVEIAKDYLIYIGWKKEHFDLYRTYTYNTLDYATAYERGCIIKDSGSSSLFVIEKQRDLMDNNYNDSFFYSYINVAEYEKNNDNLFHRKKIVKLAIEQLEALRTKEKLKAADGTWCRERTCPGGFFMYSEPDGIVDDGKFTCQSCQEHLRGLAKWPPKQF